MIKESKEILVFYNEDFVNLSGDNNPMHTNSTISRRLLFGKPVIHGVYSVFLLLDSFFSFQLDDNRIKYLKVKFLQPIFDGDLCEMTVLEINDGYEINGYVNAENKIYLFIKLDSVEKSNHTNYLNSCPELQLPAVINTDNIVGKNFKLDLYLDVEKFNKIFSCLTNKINYNLFSILLASTRTVGVYCPGANSLYSELLISENNLEVADFNLTVSKFYKSINLIKMQFDSLNFKGQISSFFRKPPQKQIDFKEIKQIIDKDAFVGEKVLVVGGSRGLGETTAKILAAGGASVVITYALGVNDAQTIVTEISGSGGDCEMLKLDINELNSVNRESLRDFKSIFYFATPFISTSNNEEININLYNKFNDFYIEGFKNLFNVVREFEVEKIFYPSTIFIQEMPLNLREYTMSKFYGEMVCKNLNKLYSIPQIFYPRLPKMSTDQTAGIYGDSGNDPFPILLKEINKFYN